MRLDGRVIYQLDPATFVDSDGDGVGDLEGVVRKLDHIRAVGADTLWLQPFYVSPYRDAGNDVVDHRDVSARFGTMADFENLVERCHQLNLKVMIELVVQHTSVDHPWFRAARADADSPYRDYYIRASEPRDDPAVEKPVLAAAADGVPLMGEVDVPPEQYDKYFGDADRLNAVLDFWTNNLLFLALARCDAEQRVAMAHAIADSLPGHRSSGTARRSA